MTLKELRDTQVDMFTTVFIGNSQTKEINGKMVTPRGYTECIKQLFLLVLQKAMRLAGSLVKTEDICTVPVSRRNMASSSLEENAIFIDSCRASGRKYRCRSFIQQKAPELVLDATHPYAAEVTVNIREACENTAVSEYVESPS